MPESRTVTARVVFPVSGPPIERGTVTVRGDRIESVNPHGDRTPDEDLGNAAIIPGLVNAHTHLDLSGARGLIPPTTPDTFTDWLRGVIAYRRGRTPEQVEADVADGVAECMRYGTTLIGDITAGGSSWGVVTCEPVRAVLFWELIGLSAERFDAACTEAITKIGEDWDAAQTEVMFPPLPLCRWGLSPHAPYSANHKHALALLAYQSGAKAIHLAESPGELELLEKRTGPFVPFLTDLGIWNPEEIIAHPKSYFVMRPRIDAPRLYIHCNYMRPAFTLRPCQSVVYCPRTHAAFGHPPHPFRDFLSRGVRVCLGTDSLASNPDLDILAEARFVHAKYPDFPGDALLRMVTLSGAEALGWADETGSLDAGKSADLVAVPLPDADDDPHELLLADHDGERRTMFRGEWR
jgi:cytosine/adenosine deaminase-related metal-dependent hydrolase